MDYLQQSFSVRFEYKVIFTEHLFDKSNTTLKNFFDSQRSDNIKKIFFVIDEGVAVTSSSPRRGYTLRISRTSRAISSYPKYLRLREERTQRINLNTFTESLTQLRSSESTGTHISLQLAEVQSSTSWVMLQPCRIGESGIFAFQQRCSHKTIQVLA